MSDYKLTFPTNGDTKIVKWTVGSCSQQQGQTNIPSFSKPSTDTWITLTPNVEENKCSITVASTTANRTSYVDVNFNDSTSPCHRIYIEQTSCNCTTANPKLSADLTIPILGLPQNYIIGSWNASCDSTLVTSMGSFSTSANTDGTIRLAQPIPENQQHQLKTYNFAFFYNYHDGDNPCYAGTLIQEGPDALCDCNSELTTINYWEKYFDTGGTGNQEVMIASAKTECGTISASTLGGAGACPMIPSTYPKTVQDQNDPKKFYFYTKVNSNPSQSTRSCEIDFHFVKKDGTVPPTDCYANVLLRQDHAEYEKCATCPDVSGLHFEYWMYDDEQDYTWGNVYYGSGGLPHIPWTKSQLYPTTVNNFIQNDEVAYTWGSNDLRRQRVGRVIHSFTQEQLSSGCYGFVIEPLNEAAKQANLKIGQTDQYGNTDGFGYVYVNDNCEVDGQRVGAERTIQARITLLRSYVANAPSNVIPGIPCWSTEITFVQDGITVCPQRCSQSIQAGLTYFAGSWNGGPGDYYCSYYYHVELTEKIDITQAILGVTDYGSEGMYGETSEGIAFSSTCDNFYGAYGLRVRDYTCTGASPDVYWEIEYTNNCDWLRNRYGSEDAYVTVKPNSYNMGYIRFGSVKINTTNTRWYATLRLVYHRGNYSCPTNLYIYQDPYNSPTHECTCNEMPFGIGYDYMFPTGGFDCTAGRRLLAWSRIDEDCEFSAPTFSFGGGTPSWITSVSTVLEDDEYNFYGTLAAYNTVGGADRETSIICTRTLNGDTCTREQRIYQVSKNNCASMSAGGTFAYNLTIPYQGNANQQFGYFLTGFGDCTDGNPNSCYSATITVQGGTSVASTTWIDKNDRGTWYFYGSVNENPFNSIRSFSVEINVFKNGAYYDSATGVFILQPNPNGQ